jgi:hypothetical protein
MLNRWRSTTGQWAKDDTLATACLRPWQFSAWNKDDPVFKRLQGVTWSSFTLRECLRAVCEALGKDPKDPTYGARHYMTVARRAQGWPSSWGEERMPVVQIGAHLFYKGIK